jgi:hypothetical protein
MHAKQLKANHLGRFRRKGAIVWKLELTDAGVTEYIDQPSASCVSPFDFDRRKSGLTPCQVLQQRGSCRLGMMFRPQPALSE